MHTAWQGLQLQGTLSKVLAHDLQLAHGSGVGDSP